jgi:hypothetical protein
VGSSPWTIRELCLLLPAFSMPHPSLPFPQSDDKYRVSTRDDCRASIPSSRTVIYRGSAIGTTDTGSSRMEIASPSGNCGHPRSRHYCDSATSNRKPGTTPLFLKLDWFLFLTSFETVVVCTGHTYTTIPGATYQRCWTLWSPYDRCSS